MGSTMTNRSKQSKLVRFLTAPFRILNKIYMASVSSCAAGIETHGGMLTTGSVAPQPAQLPRNFSVSSASGSTKEEDVNELIRVVSARIGNRTNTKVHDIGKLEEQGRRTISMEATGGMGIKSHSVGLGKLGKIDEDTPIDFLEGDIKVVSYPRCRTYAASRRSVMY